MGAHKTIYKVFLAYVFVFISVFVYAQGSNQWINLSQDYYRFTIPESGIYRITNSELINAGVPISNFSPQNIQLFQNGEEIPCYIDGEGIGLVNYIEFYAEKNTGWFDQAMHDDLANQANPNYSLITDNASVFITWNTSTNNKRFTPETDVNFTSYTPAPYVLFSERQDYTTTYRAGETGCLYVEGEGWVDNQSLVLGGQVTKSFATPKPYIGGPGITTELSYITFSSNGHHIQLSGPGFSHDTVFAGITTIKHAFLGSASDLSATTSIVLKSIDDIDAPTDYSALAYIQLDYPAEPDFNNSTSKKFTIPASPGAKTYLEIENFNTSSDVLLYDLSRGLRISTIEDNGTIKALIPASSNPIELYLTGLSQINTATIADAPIKNHSGHNKEVVIITHPTLMTQAQAYASYRNAYLVDIEELYNQFAFGIEKHPLAIRYFVEYILENWSVKPQHLFLIGKGIDPYYTRKNESYFNSCLIPPMGTPASDVLLTAYINDNSGVSTLGTGRLAAQNGSQVEAYFNKVQEFELNEPDNWMKQMIHFGGGIQDYEQTTFRNYLKGYEQIIEDTLFGANVSTFLKTSSDPIAISKSDSVANLISSGVSLMTFFGHGSTNGFDQNIDEPENYRNQGKYPLMLANSCYSGNIQLPGNVSTSEDWVLIPNKGSIGFLAVVNEGLPYYLNVFSTRFYKNLGQSNYAQPLGTVIKSARKDMMDFITGKNALSTVQEFTLHGDPALVLNSFSKPDLAIKTQNISFIPKNISTRVDSFVVQFVVENNSMTTSKEVLVDVQHTFPDGTEEVHTVSLEGLFYRDTLEVRLPVDRVKGIGANTIQVNIDPFNQIDELNELNNIATQVAYITSTDLNAAYPYEYSIINNSSVVFKSTTGDLFSENQQSVIQLDTTHNFDSPFLITDGLSHSGGVVSWEPGTSLEPFKSYFWRVAREFQGEEDKTWSQSSFVIEPGETGWQQRHIGQLRDNTFKFIETNTTSGRLEFTTAPKTLRCHNIGSPGSGDYNSVGYSLDGIGDYSACLLPSLVVVVIDSVTLTPWESNHGDYNQHNFPGCRSNRNDYYFIFGTDNASVSNLVDFINNDVPTGNYFMIYSFIRGDYETWSETNVLAFESWGAVNVRFAEDTHPYIFYSQKGNPGISEELLGDSPTDILDFNVEIKGNFTYGFMTSSLVGPALNWDRFYWEYSGLEINPNELAFVQILGVDAGNNETLLFDSVMNNEVDLSAISAFDYPYMRLKFHTVDEEFKTPTQIDSWSVYYEPVADLAINPNRGWYFYADTLAEAEQGAFSISFENISMTDTDSLQVAYWIQDKNNNTVPIDVHNIKPLKAGEFISDTVEFNSMGIAGNNSIWVELNPKTTLKSASYQIEQNRFNNLAFRPFFVAADKANPILDVTFDGIHILDGDIVSAKPEITLHLSDENAFIPLSDTSLFRLYIKSAQTGEEEVIETENNPKITFTPAQLPDNKAQLSYQAEFLEDGDYELRVQAVDPSGNESGEYDYQIAFKIINESTITNVFNYPNPFSSSTQFVFELTGSVLPEEMQIDILTVTGKIVKVIFLEDLGPLSIGRNISEYRWDGRDMYGDLLANGVYFYRVRARINGEEIKQRDVGTNKYFSNGFGKMYIMR